MQSNKTSKKINKTTELSVAPATEQIIPDSKPAKQTSAKRTPAPSTVVAKSSTPSLASHHHSKVSLPVSHIEEVIAEIVPAAPLNHTAASPNHDDVARLAYSFFEERNHAHGFAEQDWTRAVKTLSASA